MKGVVFTYLLTYGGAAAALFNPFLGLLVYVCFAIVKPDSMWQFSLPAGNYSRIVAIGLLMGWMFRGFGNWHFGRARGIVVALLAFYFWAVISATQARHQEVAWQFIEELSKIVLPIVVGITIIDSIHKMKMLAWCIVVSQGYVALELNLSYLHGFNRVREVGFGGMDNNSVAIAMNSCIGLAFFLGVNAERWWQKALAFAAALLMAHVVLFSFSRGGMLGMMMTGAVAFLLIPKRPIHYATFAVTVLVILRLAGPEVRDRFGSSFVGQESLDWSAAGRLDLWANCLDSLAKNPIFGLGPANWPLTAPQYGWPLGKSAHTLWLEVGAELGWPGLVSLMLFHLLCVVRLLPFVRASSQVADPWARYLASMIVASFVGFAISSQFVSLVGLEIPYYVTLLGAGVLKVSIPVAMQHEDAESECLSNAVPVPNSIS